MTGFAKSITRIVSLTACAALLFATAACGTATAADGATGGEAWTESSSELARVKNAGKLVFATEGTYAPYNYHDKDSGELTGFDVDIAKAVAEKIGVKAEFAEGNFDGLLAGVDAGKYDTVADQISATDERKAKYDFTDPYTYSYGVVVANKNNTAVKSFDDVKGLRSAQTGTSNWNQIAQEKGAEIVQVGDFGQSVVALETGRADISFNDGLSVLDYIKQHPDTTIRIAAKSEKTPSAQFPFRKGSDDLVKEIDKAIAALQKDGTFTKISEKYFGEDFTQK